MAKNGPKCTLLSFFGVLLTSRMFWNDFENTQNFQKISDILTKIRSPQDPTRALGRRVRPPAY